MDQLIRQKYHTFFDHSPRIWIFHEKTLRDFCARLLRWATVYFCASETLLTRNLGRSAAILRNQSGERIDPAEARSMRSARTWREPRPPESDFDVVVDPGFTRTTLHSVAAFVATPGAVFSPPLSRPKSGLRFGDPFHNGRTRYRTHTNPNGWPRCPQTPHGGTRLPNRGRCCPYRR